MSFLQIILVIMHGAKYGQYYGELRALLEGRHDRLVDGFTNTYNQCLITSNVVSSNPAQARCTTLSDEVCQ